MPIRILLVEDDEDDVVLTRQLLRDINPDGYELDWVDDFEEGLNRLAAAGYDVCLVDYQLGPRDGVEFIAAATERGVGAPIILLTGQGDRAIDVAAMNAGAADFLNKTNLSASLLERAIRYSIQQKKAEQQRIRLFMEQAARAEAVAENRAKDQFLAVLSHELRTPLTAVLLGLGTLEQEEGLPESARDVVSILRRNIELEARLIDDLLDLTRITRGKLELRKEVVDLHEQIQHAVRCCCAADIHEKTLTVSADTAAGEFHMWGDPARVQQVLWNLIKNAVKFTPPGGRIDIRTGNTPDGRFFVEVKDTGIGIRPDALPRIFNAFEQTGRSITRQFGGLGLGLAICRALVELHGGSIAAQSAGPGQGALFRIEFPVTAPLRQTDVEQPAGPSAQQRAANRILLVEDHADTAALMQRLLRLRGYNVHAVHTVADALRAASAGGVSIVISDIGLPDGSGLDLMGQLAARTKVRGIALSGYGMEEDVERSRAAGFSEHLTKPVNLSELEAAIDRVIRGEPRLKSVTADPAVAHADH
jgi:signal transduction histidine kinase